ncbi:hypothetical protein BV25DRAFT_1915494 [Artomyces pyxidatus]|uniref:Uncharacterized protein n=1 Tax=Artomyces pyxidatus TaxID=48021 RepID=A0ACB8T596_9AGAM|nr:hypothetical protein BV25DRAFT_1915494 [Artomyces pyxidatus]
MSSTLFSSFLDLFLLLLSISRFLVGVLLVIIGGVAADIFHMLLPVLSGFSSLILKKIPWGLIVRGIIALMSAGWQNTPSALRFIRLCLYEYAQDTHDTLSLHIHAIHALVTDPMFRACAWAFVGLVIMAVENVSGYIYLDYTDPNLWALVPVERHPFPEGCGTPTVCLRKLVCGRHDTNNSECQSLASSIWSSEEPTRPPHDGDLAVVLFSRPLATAARSSRFICWKRELLAITFSSPDTLCVASSSALSPPSMRRIRWKDDATQRRVPTIRSFDHGPRAFQSIHPTLPFSSHSSTPNTSCIPTSWNDHMLEGVEVQLCDEYVSDPDESTRHILIPIPSPFNSEKHDDEVEALDNVDGVLPSLPPTSLHPSPSPSADSSHSRSAEISEDEDDQNEDEGRALKRATPDFRLNPIRTPTFCGHPTFVSPPPSPTPAGRNKPSRFQLAPLEEECEMLVSSSLSSSVGFADLTCDMPKFVLEASPARPPQSILPPLHDTFAPPFQSTLSTEALAEPTGSNSSLSPIIGLPSPPSSPEWESSLGQFISIDVDYPPSPPDDNLQPPLHAPAIDSALALLFSAPTEIPQPGVFAETEEGTHVRMDPKHHSWTESDIQWSSATFPVYIVRRLGYRKADIQIVSRHQEYYVSAMSLTTGIVQSSFTTLPL